MPIVYFRLIYTLRLIITVACHCVFGTYFLGKIIRLVQEKYLRADVECGYLFGRIISQVN